MRRTEKEAKEPGEKQYIDGVDEEQAQKMTMSVPCGRRLSSPVTQSRPRRHA
jgi:hypothetical protein